MLFTDIINIYKVVAIIIMNNKSEKYTCDFCGQKMKIKVVEAKTNKKICTDCMLGKNINKKPPQNLNELKYD